MTRKEALFEWRGLITAAALAVSVLILLGLLGRWVFWFDLFSHPRPYITVGLVLIVVVLALSGAPRRAILFLGVAGISVASLAWTLFLVPAKPQDVPSDLSVLSYNVLAWNRSPDRAVSIILDSGADVVVVLEGPGIEGHLAALDQVYPHRTGCEVSAACDLILLSKHPFLSVERPRLPSGRDRVAIARIIVSGKPVAIAGIHISKPYYDGVHAWEMETFRRALTGLDGPLVVAGDFNQAPWSAHLIAFMRGTGLTMIAGYRPTWPDHLGVLGVPIDHMAIRGGVVPVAVEVLADAGGSNHRALLARFALPD